MMHRFRARAKSDASKRAPSMASTASAPSLPAAPSLNLPPASDFRTSLILTDLSRRFTLLRGQHGGPLSIEDVRSRFAQQRASGRENHVTEEEEDIMIDALIRAHSIDPAASASDSDQGYVTANGNESMFGGRYDSSELPSPVSPSSKRHSNNMFGSGRVRDQSYLRNRSNASTTSASKRSARKVSNSTANTSVLDPLYRQDILLASEPPTEDENEGSDTPNLHAISSPDQGSAAFNTYLSHSAFSPAQIRRASLALQDVIQEFEEGEEDEKILAPRSRRLVDPGEPTQDHEQPIRHGEGPTGYVEAIAWSNGQSGIQDNTSFVLHERAVTASPTQRMDAANRLPGYVPGMHRPITPRDSATDTDAPGFSSTPQSPHSSVSSPGREYSVSSPSSPTHTERALPQGVLSTKRGSVTGYPLRTRPRQLSMGDYGDAGGSSSDSTQTPLKSALSDRRRPVSPLVDSAYASSGRSATPPNNLMEAWSPTTVSLTASSSSFRPMEPTSSVASGDGHRELASSTSSELEVSDDYYSNPSIGTTRGVASPPLPGSPNLNGGTGLANIVSSLNGATTNVIVDEPIRSTPTPSRVVSLVDIGPSTVSPHSFRAPTPSRSPARIVSSSTPSRTTTPISRSATPNLQKRGHSRNGSLVTDAHPDGRSPRAIHFNSQFAPSSGLRSNPLMMSPMLNSSRSSLASMGSSYHSWDEDQLGNKPAHKRGVSVFIENDAPWKKRQSGYGMGLAAENIPDPDDIKEVLAGLTRQDMAALQERLIVAAAKRKAPLSNARSVSGQKRRRASASQSLSSFPIPSEPEIPQPLYNTSPLPPVSTSSSPSSNPSAPSLAPVRSSKNSAEHAMKANALLHAMMDSIESSPAPVAVVSTPQSLAPQSSFSSEEPQSTPPTTIPPTPTIETSQRTPDAEAPTSSLPALEQDPRHKALADALFGSDSDATIKDTRQALGRSQSLRAFAMPTVDSIPSPKEDERLLAEEVQRRAMAATAALKSPSTSRFTDTGRKPIKKVNTRQISSPQLLSTSTSADTIPPGLSDQANQTNQSPLPAGQPSSERVAQSSKLSQRIKKFTLRAKTPNLTGEEVTPYVIEGSAPSTGETSADSGPNSSSDPIAPHRPPLTVSNAVADDSNSSSAPTTPTSAQPRLRGLMARLRKGRKDSLDSRDKGMRVPSPLGPNAKLSTSPLNPIPPPPHVPAALLRAEPIPPPDNFSSSTLADSGVDSPQHASTPLLTPSVPSLPHSAPANIESQSSESSQVPRTQAQQPDEDAVRQLYDAASHLGLDRAAISDMLARSYSTSSKSTAWTYARSPTTASTGDTPITPPASAPLSGLERAASVTTPKASRGSITLGRQLSHKPFRTQPARTPSPATAPQSGEDSSPRASVVRRMLILPSQQTQSPSDISRRPSTSRHRRSRSISNHSSKSSKSVQDRAPTPPPSRAPNKRFSKDQSPPVPQLPSGLDGNTSATLQPSRAASRVGRGSNYDSLYEMYAEHPGPPDLDGVQSDSAAISSAIEVLELSDGQIVWSVVDGLRSAADDEETDDSSPFPYRMSRSSESSTRETHEVRFKEHQRTASKGSQASIGQKSLRGPRGNRPETRIYFRNTSDIGQLIDDLSRSTEAGQINIVPSLPGISGSHLRPPSGAHSAPSFNSSFSSSTPDGDWTLEERIDHMIASNRKRAGL